VGYVLQMDFLLPFLTVRETLRFAARLRLPASRPRADKMAVVEARTHVTHTRTHAHTHRTHRTRRPPSRPPPFRPPFVLPFTPFPPPSHPLLSARRSFWSWA
jgi:hypothetical protein